MKNKECALIRDLLPLYKDNAVSGESGEIISAHLESCEDCKAEFAALETAIPEMADAPDTAEGFSKLIKKQRIKKIITIVLATIVSVAVIFSGWFALTDLTIMNVPADDIEVVKVFRFENGQGKKKFCVLYKSPVYSITSTRRQSTTSTGPRDEVTGLLTMEANEQKPVLSGFKTDKFVEEAWIIEAENLIYGDIDVLTFADEVIWTEEENGDDPVPEYVYYYEELQESGSWQWVVDFEQNLIGGGNELLGFKYWTLDGGKYLHHEF